MLIQDLSTFHVASTVCSAVACGNVEEIRFCLFPRVLQFMVSTFCVYLPAFLKVFIDRIDWPIRRKRRARSNNSPATHRTTESPTHRVWKLAATDRPHKGDNTASHTDCMAAIP